MISSSVGVRATATSTGRLTSAPGDTLVTPSSNPAPNARVLRLNQNPSANLASSLMRSGDQGGVKTISELTDLTPSSSPTNSSICSVTWGPIGHPGVVRVNVT